MAPCPLLMTNGIVYQARPMSGANLSRTDMMQMGIALSLSSTERLRRVTHMTARDVCPQSRMDRRRSLATDTTQQTGLHRANSPTELALHINSTTLIGSLVSPTPRQ